MSKESLEQFINQVAESEELQAKIGEEDAVFTSKSLQDNTDLFFG